MMIIWHLSIPVNSRDRWDRHIVCKVSLNSWLRSPERSAFSEGVGWPPVPERLRCLHSRAK